MRFDQYTYEDFKRIEKQIEDQDMAAITTMDLCGYIMYLHRRIKDIERRNDLKDNEFYS